MCRRPSGVGQGVTAYMHSARPDKAPEYEEVVLQSIILHDASLLSDLVLCVPCSRSQWPVKHPATLLMARRSGQAQKLFDLALFCHTVLLKSLQFGDKLTHFILFIPHQPVVSVFFSYVADEVSRCFSFYFEGSVLDPKFSKSCPQSSAQLLC